MAKGWFINFLPCCSFHGSPRAAMKKCCKLEQPVASGEQTAKFHLWFDPKRLGLSRASRALSVGVVFCAPSGCADKILKSAGVTSSDILQICCLGYRAARGPPLWCDPGPFGSFSWEARAAGNLNIYIAASLKPLLSCDPNVTRCWWLHLSTQCKALVGAPARSCAGPFFHQRCVCFGFFNRINCVSCKSAEAQSRDVVI